MTRDFNTNNQAWSKHCVSFQALTDKVCDIGTDVDAILSNGDDSNKNETAESAQEALDAHHRLKEELAATTANLLQRIEALAERFRRLDQRPTSKISNSSARQAARDSRAPLHVDSVWDGY